MMVNTLPEESRTSVQHHLAKPDQGVDILGDDFLKPKSDEGEIYPQDAMKICGEGL